MTQTINTDIILRINTMNQEFHLLAANTNLFMKTIREELLQQEQDNKTSRSICDSNTQNICELRWHLDQQVGNLFKKYEEQVNVKILEFECIQQQKETQEQNRIQEIEQRFNQYEGIIKELDKKLESKSNDRYIASIISKNLMTNQEIGQFIVDKVLRQAQEIMQHKLNDFQKLIEERITHQFHLISNYQIKIRKHESKWEDFQNQLNIIKEFQIDFQKQQMNKFQMFQNQNSLFEQLIQQQVHSIMEQSQQSQTYVKDLREQIINQFQNNSVFNNNDQISLNLVQDKQKIRDLEQLQNETKLKLEQMEFDCCQQSQKAQNQIFIMENEMKNIYSTINVIYEKMNSSNVNPQIVQDTKQGEKQFKPFLITQKIKKQFSLKNQIGQIESIFRHVQLLFNHICKTYQYEKKLESLKQKSEQIKNNSGEQKIPTDTMDHPQYIFQQYLQQQNQEQQKLEVQKNQYSIQNPQNQQKINLQSLFQNNDDLFFGDNKLYQNQASRHLHIQGKQHGMEIRPQAEMNQLSAKVKQISTLFCDIDLKHQFDISQSVRPGSEKNKFPKLNSKSFNLSNNDDQ